MFQHVHLDCFVVMNCIFIHSFLVFLISIFLATPYLDILQFRGIVLILWAFVWFYLDKDLALTFTLVLWPYLRPSTISLSCSPTTNPLIGTRLSCFIVVNAKCKLPEILRSLPIPIYRTGITGKFREIFSSNCLPEISVRFNIPNRMSFDMVVHRI